MLAEVEVGLPAFLNPPTTVVGSLGDEAAELAESLGQDVGEVERVALRALMPVQANGMPAGLEAGIVCGRQNVKSWAMEMALIHDAWVTRVGRCVWSAHLTKTSDENFTHLRGLIESFDWLSKRVRRVYAGNGNHSVHFTDGRTIEFVARETGRTGRGLVKINRLTLDEWLFGTAAMQGAMIPAMGAAGDRYIRYGSSPGKLTSESLRTLRDRGRRGGDPSLSWCEWTAERRDPDGRRVLPSCADPLCNHMPGLVAGCYMDDPRILAQVNPALGRRISWEFVAQERLALSPTEYARERCGIWEDPPEGDVTMVFPRWADREVERIARPAGVPVALGVDTAWDRASTWVAAAWLHPDGRVVVELVGSGRGTDWVRGWLLDGEPTRVARLAPRAVAMQGAGAPVSGLLDDLKLHLPAELAELPRGLSGADVAKACARTFDLVESGGLVWAKHPALASAAKGARSRPMGGDSWVIDRAGSQADASPLVAACAAVWALVTEPEPEEVGPPNCW